MNAEQARNSLKNLAHTLADLTPAQHELFDVLFCDWCCYSHEAMLPGTYLAAYERCIRMAQDLA